MRPSILNVLQAAMLLSMLPPESQSVIKQAINETARRRKFRAMSRAWFSRHGR